MHAAGLNKIEVFIREGMIPLPPGAILGTDGAGVVEEVGNGSTHFKAISSSKINISFGDRLFLFMQREFRNEFLIFRLFFLLLCRRAIEWPFSESIHHRKALTPRYCNLFAPKTSPTGYINTIQYNTIQYNTYLQYFNNFPLLFCIFISKSRAIFVHFFIRNIIKFSHFLFFYSVFRGRARYAVQSSGQVQLRGGRFARHSIHDRLL